MLSHELNAGVRETNCETLSQSLTDEKIKLIDVRRPDEFNDLLGHISRATLITLGPDLEQYLNTEDKHQTIVFICRSGGRSHKVTEFSQRLGFTNTFNLKGGMLRWNELKLPVSKL